jgi:hypothetical protein
VSRDSDFVKNALVSPYIAHCLKMTSAQKVASLRDCRAVLAFVFLHPFLNSGASTGIRWAEFVPEQPPLILNFNKGYVKESLKRKRQGTEEIPDTEPQRAKTTPQVGTERLRASVDRPRSAGVMQAQAKDSNGKAAGDQVMQHANSSAEKKRTPDTLLDDEPDTRPRRLSPQSESAHNPSSSLNRNQVLEHLVQQNSKLNILSARKEELDKEGAALQQQREEHRAKVLELDQRIEENEGKGKEIEKEEGEIKAVWLKLAEGLPRAM